ncbi:MAG: cytoplasmic protein [Chloroflexi bacterium]|nr:cytoplasmic protein [Chloroflexota bacterium]
MVDDAAKVAPHVYAVRFEDEHARLLEVIMQPGDRSELHSHPGYVVHLLSGGRVRFTSAAGETAELELPEGATIWRDAEEHATENIGGTVVHALFFEPK